MLSNNLKPFLFLTTFILCSLCHQSALAERTTTYFHNDGLGSVVAATDESGDLLWRKNYTPYGQQIDSDVDDEKLSYTGKPHDDDTGLTYFGARYYDPEVGRFMSIDPAGVIGNVEIYAAMFNRYAYANNSPYKYIDPDGRATCLNTSCDRSSIDLDLTGDGKANVTFVNDNPSNPAPPNDFTTETALMIENAVLSSGVDSININSTSGGVHSPTSRHGTGQGADINRINGKSVGSSGLDKSLQDTFAKENNIRENYGPAYLEKTEKGKAFSRSDPKSTKTTQTGSPAYNAGLVNDHKDHIHVTGQK